MNLKNITYSLLAIFISLFVLAKPAKANEGTVELHNVAGGNSRCYVVSIMMPERNFQMLMSCRDLVYPPGENLFQYVLWEVTTEGKVERLERVGIGRVQLSTDKPFNSLFITSETDGNPRAPSDRVIMRGDIKPISILESSANAAAISEVNPSPSLIPVPNTTKSILATPVPKAGQQKESSIISTLVRIFLYIVIGLVIFVILVTVINSRRRQTTLPPLNPLPPQPPNSF
jgi:hypothetical protein